MGTERDGVHVLAPDLDGCAVGFPAYTLDAKSDTREVQLVAVHPEYQTRRIATKLCSPALREMKKRGGTLARIETGGTPPMRPLAAPARRRASAASPLVRCLKEL